MTAVYRGLTPAQLQKAYSARDAVPEHPEIFTRWQQLSSDYRNGARAVLDVPYGTADRERLDLFLPEADNPPLHLFIHGGYWQAMDKSFFSFIAREMNRQGIAVAIPSYGLCPDVTLDKIAVQIQRCITWLATRGEAQGYDSRNIHLSGHSAGGQLIAMMMAAEWRSEEEQVAAGSIQSALSISGVFDLEPLIHTPINNALKLDRESARRNSPIRKNPTLKIPLILTAGGAESSEFHRQSRELTEQWGEAGIHTACHILPGLNHFTMVEQLGMADNELLHLALAQAKGASD